VSSFEKRDYSAAVISKKAGIEHTQMAATVTYDILVVEERRRAASKVVNDAVFEPRNNCATSIKYGCHVQKITRRDTSMQSRPR